MKKIIVALLVTALGDASLAKSSSCKESYIPAHTEAELVEVREWAAGAAFSLHAKHTGYEFDTEAYMNDLPNKEIFYFGRVFGASCYDYYVDVVSEFVSFTHALDTLYSKSLQGDSQALQKYYDFYDRNVVKLGFSKYITPVKGNNASSIVLSSVELSN